MDLLEMGAGITTPSMRSASEVECSEKVLFFPPHDAAFINVRFAPLFYHDRVWEAAIGDSHHRLGDDA